MKLLIQAGYLIAVTLFVSPPVLAQVIEAAAEEEPPQYYQVELIVFRHLDQTATTAEIPRLPEPEMTDFLEQDLARLSGQMPLTDITDAPAVELAEPPDEARPQDAEDQSNEWLPVAPEGLLLTDMVSAIDRIPAYELVTYMNWAQVAPDVTVAKALDIEEIGADPSILTGSVELHERRYLHLALEVTLTDPKLLGVFGGSEALPALQDSRRIRLEKVQYFDQPQFGVIAVVSRLKLPEAEPSD
jgi:hypothetical protein